jgi:hypothetical protein
VVSTQTVPHRNATKTRTLPNRRAEAKPGCSVLNRMTALGMPPLSRPVEVTNRRGRATGGRSMHESPRLAYDPALVATRPTRLPSFLIAGGALVARGTEDWPAPSFGNARGSELGEGSYRARIFWVKAG